MRKYLKKKLSTVQNRFKKSSDVIGDTTEDFTEKTISYTQFFIAVIKESWIKVFVSGFILLVMFALGFTISESQLLPLYAALFLLIMAILIFLIFYYANKGKSLATSDLRGLAKSHARMDKVIVKLVEDQNVITRAKDQKIKVLEEETPYAICELLVRCKICLNCDICEKSVVVNVNRNFEKLTGWRKQEINNQLMRIKHPIHREYYFIGMLFSLSDYWRMIRGIIKRDGGDRERKEYDNVLLRRKDRELVSVFVKFLTLRQNGDYVSSLYISDQSETKELQNRIYGLNYVVSDIIDSFNIIEQDYQITSLLLDQINALEL